MGHYWTNTKYSKLYQLYRRVERVARELDTRRHNGWVPTKKYIAELYDVSIELKVLDKSLR
jgi:hypothetical protein